MSSYRDEAFVLEIRDLHERDRIVGFLARRHGRRRAVARGARARHSRFAGQVQLLAKVRVDWWEKEGRDLGRIDSIELIRPARRLSGELEDVLLSFYLAEHVATFAPEAEPDDDLFRLLDTVLQALEDGVDRDLATAYLEVWVLRLAGIFPPPGECGVCGRELAVTEPTGAALLSGGDQLVCLDCADGHRTSLRLDASALGLLHAIGRRPLAALAADPLERPDLVAVRSLSTAVRRAFLQAELKSWEVIESTLSGLARATALPPPRA